MNMLFYQKEQLTLEAPGSDPMSMKKGSMIKRIRSSTTTP